MFDVPLWVAVLLAVLALTSFVPTCAGLLDLVDRLLGYPFSSCRIDWNRLRAEGAYALVTGPTSGIGRGIARALASRGLNLVLVSRNATKLAAAKEELVGLYPGVCVEVVCVDLSSPSPTDDAALRSRLRTRTNPIRVLVNNAGISLGKIISFTSMPLETHERLVRLNIGAVVRYTSVLFERELEPLEAVINLSSIVSYFPIPFYSTYPASKTFISTWSRALHSEYVGRVHVEAVTPGYVVSNLTGGEDKKPLLTMPRWDQYARAVVQQAGYRSLSYPYWVHTLTVTGLRTLPSWQLAPSCWKWFKIISKYFGFFR